jgi:hypothetical protein
MILQKALYIPSTTAGSFYRLFFTWEFLSQETLMMWSSNCRNITLGSVSLITLLLAGAAWGQSTTISTTNFGMQCGLGSSNCAGYVLPNEQAQPGTFRLWDSSTYWSVLQPSDFTGCSDIQQLSNMNTYCWDHLDKWLDTIAGQNPPTIKAVIYDFGGVPCQIATLVNNACVTLPNEPNGSGEPPTDLNSSGSTYFDRFVYYLVTHCSPNRNCVANIIKDYEMWNEPNLGYWKGTETQLEQMIFPARGYIWSNVTNAVVMTPSFSFYNNNYSTWVQSWLTAENTNGTRSNALAFHVYLADVIPETQFTCYISSATSSAGSGCGNAGNPSFLNIKNNTTGWSTIPWLNTETNWDGSTYACTPGDLPADCTGQIVRWQLLQDAAGASSVDWYYWYDTIGNTSYEPAYYYMMQYLVGGKFTSACSYNTSTTIGTCAFKDANSNTDLWVWTTNTTPQSYSTGYTKYWNLAGTCQAIPGSFTVTVEPYLLVNSSCTIQP